MFCNVITIIVVTVTVFVLAAHWQTPDPTGSRGESDGIAIPLTKRSDTDAREFHVTSHDGKIIHGPSDTDGSERNMGTPHPFAVKRDGSGAGVDLAKFRHGVWYGTIFIGTPPKPFTVQLNTGIIDLIIPTSTGNENCRSHSHLWDLASFHAVNTNLELYTAPSQPITNLDLHMDFSYVFADGRSISGKQYMDNVTIAGFTADRQTICAATTYSSGMRASKFGPDGILGLARPPPQQSGLQVLSPLFYTLFNEGKLPRPVFALKLTYPGGELFLGGTNTALYIQSTLVFTPVTSPHRWQLNIDDIRVNGRIIVRNVPAIIDTSSSLIYGDVNGVLAVHQAGGGKPDGMSNIGYYTFPCGSFPIVTFTIGERPYDVPPRVLNMGRPTPKSQDCFTGIVVPSETHDIWTLGSLFLEMFYTVVDFGQAPRIGFAQLS